MSTSRLKPEPIAFSCFLPAPAAGCRAVRSLEILPPDVAQGLRCLDDAARAKDCFEICDDRPGSRPLFARVVPLESADNDSVAERAEFMRRLEQRLAQAPGVTSITFADGLPLDFGSRLVRVARHNDVTLVPSRITRVAPGYLETLGIRLLRGRDIRLEDGTSVLAIDVGQPGCEGLCRRRL